MYGEMMCVGMTRLRIFFLIGKQDGIVVCIFSFSLLLDVMVVFQTHLSQKLYLSSCCGRQPLVPWFLLPPPPPTLKKRREKNGGMFLKIFFLPPKS